MKKIGITVLAFSILFGYQAQEKLTNKEGSEYEFKILKELEANPVQNQNRTGTCWSFSSLSFFESELQRLGKGTHNLSEMFIVRNAYIGKAENYLRMYGTFTWVINRCGIVPESVYDGLNYGSDIHLHEEMEKIMHAMVKELAKKPQRGKLTPNWKLAFEGVVDAYLGELPSDLNEFQFEVNGKSYNPFSYAEKLNLKMDDYVSLTSYTHHPFYETFVLEVQDNWAMQQSYNIPIDEFMMVMEEAVINGYTFAWGADVSEKGFSSRDALAILPQDESTIREKGKDNRYFNSAGAEKISNAFMSPVEEKVVTQQERQDAFDSQETTDDHGMHITGLVEDQNGTKYFKVKNSWGTEYNQCGGYFYASFPYVRYKTMNILVHKDAVPKSIKKKIGL